MEAPLSINICEVARTEIGISEFRAHNRRAHSPQNSHAWPVHDPRVGLQLWGHNDKPPSEGMLVRGRGLGRHCG